MFKRVSEDRDELSIVFRLSWQENQLCDRLRGRQIAKDEEVVEGALRIEKEGVTSPARKDTVVAGLRHTCRLACRNRDSLDDKLTAAACSSSLCAIDTIDRGGQRTAVGRREADSVPARWRFPKRRRS